jgi:hypothetical protein
MSRNVGGIAAAASVLIMKDHLGVGPLAALDAVQPHGAVLGAGDEALGLQPATAIFRDKNRGSGWDPPTFLSIFFASVALIMRDSMMIEQAPVARAGRGMGAGESQSLDRLWLSVIHVRDEMHGTVGESQPPLRFLSWNMQAAHRQPEQAGDGVGVAVEGAEGHRRTAAVPDVQLVVVAACPHRRRWRTLIFQNQNQGCGDWDSPTFIFILSSVLIMMIIN